MSNFATMLRHIEKRPGMYFGGDCSRSIRVLRAFLMGCKTAHQYPDSVAMFDCFREWVAIHYRVYADNRDGFDLILERVGNDEEKAFDEFFRLLPEYLTDRELIGWEGIQLRFSDVQDAYEAGAGNSDSEPKA